MILLLDTSTPVCKLTFVNGADVLRDEWQADRGMADGLIGYVRGQLAACDKNWTDVRGIGVYKGPGSFTGLRIGITVCNTIADANAIPIVGETGDDWQATCQQRLTAGENDQLVMPLYGREANITKPRK
ncbi:HAD-superfamily hydrolase, subfamily IA, variant 3 [Candidatus Saccharibacteria bacterium RAAC3_TM7_1]|nr:HAD-superfamily hydrolase, subfamily IA, variant 3 [Candidatus Saccharibacteria bacterium RAAC3_TM7_1]